MRRCVVALGWLLLMPAAARAGETLATSCPAYPAHLHAARAALVRGDRVAATSELRRAQSALESCLHEEAAGQSLLAEHDTSRHDG
jgi:hypothetical protein